MVFRSVKAEAVASVVKKATSGIGATSWELDNKVSSEIVFTNVAMSMNVPSLKRD